MKSLGSHKDFPGSYKREAHTLQSLNSLSLSTDTALYSGPSRDDVWDLSVPWGDSVQKFVAGPSHGNLKS